MGVQAVFDQASNRARQRMKLLPTILASVLCSGTIGAAPAGTNGRGAEASVAVPIESAAQLRDYLERGGASPLDLLSAPAKRRFLDSIRFGANGLAGFSAEELEAELTQDEARTILKLFGSERYTPPASQMRARHLNIGATETAQAETQFDDLLGASRTHSPARGVAAAYGRWFGPRQSPTGLHALSDGDLALTFRAATNVFWFDPAPVYADDMRRDLAELHLRHVAAPNAYEAVYRALIRSRDFAAADDLRARYPEAHLPPLPAVRDVAGHPGPTLLQSNQAGTELVRRAFAFDQPAQVIVIAGCHFARDAARDIESDPNLRAAFSRHVLWLTPQDGDPADPDLIRWNREHPLTAMRSAYRESEWPQIDSWAMPTFYFFKDGKREAKIVGWQREAVVAEMRKLELMP